MTRPERGDRCSGLWSGNWYRSERRNALDSHSCLLFVIEQYCFLKFNWPTQGSFIKAPQREGAPWLWVAEWIRRLLRQRVQCGIGHGLYRQPGKTSCLGLKHRWVGRPFRARRLMSLHPGLKHPTSQSLRRGRTFGVTHHNARGSIA